MTRRVHPDESTNDQEDPMSNLVEHAKHELATLRSGEPDEMQDEMDRCVLHLVDTFSEQGHSGFSASYAVGLVEKLLRFEPIRPLTGAAEEWQQVADGLEQNRRCSHVFREKGVAYDIEAVVYRERDGCGFTGWDSARRVKFPYTPKSRTVPAWLRRPERLLARLRGQLRP